MSPDAYVNQQQTEETTTILEVRGLNVVFPTDRGTSRVLNGVTMDIRRREILGIIGESGSGKSMFASALLDAVVEPGQVSGDITYYSESGEAVEMLDLTENRLKEVRWEEISLVFQGAMSSFNPTMKIGDHFKETIRAHTTDMEERMEHAEQLLRDLYLDPDRVLDAYPHELSGGMTQRALIALSLILEPSVLVMDEPTAALDLLMQRSIISLLSKLQDAYDLTIVFITHDLPLIAELADRLAVMYAFEFVELGTSEEIISNSAHPYTRALIKSIPRRDAPVEDMTVIEGKSPDPVNTPSGCSYHPRCPIANETCEQKDPDLRRVGASHDAACFYWEDARKTIPYAISGEEQ